jgi:hypothetical protein
MMHTTSTVLDQPVPQQLGHMTLQVIVVGRRGRETEPDLRVRLDRRLARSSLRRPAVTAGTPPS